MSAPATRSFEILGVPYDGAATLGWPGARQAPAKIREALGWITMRTEKGLVYSLETGQLHDAPTIVDGGDVHVIPHDLEATLSNTSAAVSRSLQADRVPIILGGDDSTLFSGSRGVHDGTNGTIAIIHFDAHLDVMDENEAQGAHSQSSGMRRSLELPRASADHSIQVGLRHFNFPSSQAYVNSAGPAQITAYEFDSLGTDATVNKILNRIAGADTVFLSFDIDAVDPAHAPGAGAHEPGGLTSRQAIDAVRALAPYCDAFAVTEVNPMTDHRDMTSNLAAYLVYYFATFGAERLTPLTEK